MGPGEYIIVPRTSGCNLKKVPGSKLDFPFTGILDETGELSSIAALQIKDLFRRLDTIVISNALEYSEFREFYERIDHPMTQEEFTAEVLPNFCSSDKVNSGSGAINRRGYLDFFRHAIATRGRDTVVAWLEKWGYD